MFYAVTIFTNISPIKKLFIFSWLNILFYAYYQGSAFLSTFLKKYFKHVPLNIVPNQLFFTSWTVCDLDMKEDQMRFHVVHIYTFWESTFLLTDYILYFFIVMTIVYLQTCLFLMSSFKVFFLCLFFFFEKVMFRHITSDVV